MRLCTWFAGVDLDSRYLTATLGFSTDDQAPRILGSKVFEVQSAPGQFPDFQRGLRAALPEAGNWFHMETGGALTKVAVAVPGSMIQEVPSSGACEFGTPTRIDSSVIDLARRRALERAGRLGPVVGSMVHSYDLDGHSQSTAPFGAFATSLGVEMTSWFARPAILQPVVDAVNDSGFDVGMVMPRAVACAEATLTPLERREGATVVMIGDSTTELATFIDSTLVDVYSVPLGRQPLVVELARACRVSVEVIDRLDLGLMMDRVPSDPIVQRVRTVLSAWGTALFSAIRRRLEERNLAWRLQAGIVIANPERAFPTLDDRAARVVGTPARFATINPSFERQSGASRRSFAALGLIPLQWKSTEVESPRIDIRTPDSAVTPVVNNRELAGSGGIGHAIGRWLREFVPADPHSS